VKAALRATGTREGEPRPVPAAPIHVIEHEPSMGFSIEVETATDADAAEDIEERHVALMVAQQPELPRVLFMKPRLAPVVDLDDEITNVMQRFG
jgi:hypothetical protein